MDCDHRVSRMNQNRRRKKRPSYGVRTVEIARGRHGFGFTISGQAPCILSSIVNASPADRAGLRTGDYLIAVDGRNVSKALHDDVVRTIGSCHGLLKIQIAENYYSNSSDEDDDDDGMPTTRSRPKYPHRFRHKHSGNQQATTRLPLGCSSRGAGAPFDQLLCPTPTWRRHRSTMEAIDGRQLQVDRDYMNVSNVSIRACVAANDAPPTLRSVDDRRYLLKYLVEPRSTPLSSKILPIVAKAQDRRQKLVRKELMPTSWGDDVLEKENNRPPCCVKENQCLQRPRSCSPAVKDNLDDGTWLELPIFKAVVGYLGTIEMPKEPQMSGRRLSAIHSCIRRLRVEKKVHTLVLLKVFVNSVTLTDSNGAKLAEYPTASIAFCGAYADDKRFFGLVTARTEHSVVEQLADGSLLYSSSCHVFMADGKLVRHEDHARRAISFHLECTPADPVAGNNGQAECTEFPDTVDPILLAIVGLYRGHCGIPMDLDPNVSPQPSHTSSNSDSGIGFRDEGQNSDRVSVADVDPEYAVCLLPQQQVGINSIVKNVSSRSGSCCDPVQLSRQDQSSIAGAKLAVRAMPDPIGFTKDAEETSFNTQRLDAEQAPSKVRLSVQKYFRRRLAEQEQGKHPPPPPISSRNYENYSYEPLPPRSISPIRCTALALATDTILANGDEPSAGRAEDLDADSTPSFPDDITENTCEQEGSQDVHPPTQGEDSDTSTPDNQDDTSPEDDEGGQRWSRGGSFRKRFRIPFSQPFKHLDNTNFTGGRPSNRTFDGTTHAEMENDNDNNSRAGGFDDGGDLITVGRVGSWAITFEKLLTDPAGLHTFSEFLKKEFSCENIMFWVACERYRKTAEKSRMKELAREIFDRHLGVGASEPVNVDSKARQLTEDGLDRPDRNLFAQAQKQIYNLMKFDCYTRFLKSQLYRECILKEVAGELLPYLGATEFDPEIPYPGKMDAKDTKEKGEDRRRKSLLPWHRTKSNKLKKDKSKKSGKKDNPTAASSWSDLTGSRSSLGSSDVLPCEKPATESAIPAMNSGDEQFLCKLHLPDRSTTVVPIKSGESVSVWLRHLLERRGIDSLGVNLRFVSSNAIVDLTSDSSVLRGCEVCVEERSGDVCPRVKPSLNDLTSKVFDDLLRGRRSSVEGGHLMRRINTNRNGCTSKPPIAARPPNLQSRKNSDEMYDLWKRTQCSRLDDQRGTEINFELPEFLKMRPEAFDGRASEPIQSRSTTINNNQDDSTKLRASCMSHEKEECLLVGGIIPTHDQASNYFNSKSGFFKSRSSTSNYNLQQQQQPRYSLVRPCSHPPPKGPVPWLRSASVPVCDFPNVEIIMAALSPVKEAPASVSLKMTDKSLTPSSIPLPVTEASSINGDGADYSPPSPLDANNTKTTPPPPLPPKPRLPVRGPAPPVLPSSDKVPELASCNPDGQQQVASQQRLLNTCKRIQLKEHFLSDKFSISFV